MGVTRNFLMKIGLSYQKEDYINQYQIFPLYFKMKKTTALILKGFVESMKDDMVGQNPEIIGNMAYELFRLIENPLDIPEDKKK